MSATTEPRTNDCSDPLCLRADTQLVQVSRSGGELFVFDGRQLPAPGVDVQAVDDLVLLADDLPEVLDPPLSQPELLHQTLLPLHLIPQLISEIFLQNSLLV